MAFAAADFRFRYMEWAKTVMESGMPGVINVGSSGIEPVSLRELGAKLSDIELFGPHYYGEPDLRRRIADLAGVGPDRVLPTLGASHAHFLACASLIEPGDEVIVEAPGYEALSAVPLTFGAKIVPLPRRFEDRFQFDPDELRGLITRRTRLVLVTNLHNPSGVALAPDCLSALAECAGGTLALEGPSGRPSEHRGRSSDLDKRRRTASRKTLSEGVLGGGREPHALQVPNEPARGRSASREIGARGSSQGSRPAPMPFWAIQAGLPMEVPAGAWVVVNEVYRDFMPKGRAVPGHALGPRSVSLGSLTKVYGLGETRVGWMIADPSLLHRASRVNDFSVVNGPYIAERIGALALARRTRLLARTRSILRRNRPLLARFLRQTPSLEAVSPDGGLIIFPRVRNVRDTAAFAERALTEHGVCVVPGEFFGAAGHIRIGIGLKDHRRTAEGFRRLQVALEAATGDH